MTTPLVYSRREAAQLLHCGLTKVQQLISSGQLPSIKVGGTRLVRDEDLRQFLTALARSPR